MLNWQANYEFKLSECWVKLQTLQQQIHKKDTKPARAQTNHETELHDCQTKIWMLQQQAQEHLKYVIEKLRIQNPELEEQPEAAPVPPPRHKRRGTFSVIP